MVAYSFQKQFVDRIRAGLTAVPLSFDPPPKRQTIRATMTTTGKLRRHARQGEDVQLYTGLRSKSAVHLGDGFCTGTGKVVIRTDDMTIIVNGTRLTRAAREQFAVDDGFDDLDAMQAFWHDHHPGVVDFNGTIIYWRRKE